MLFIVVFFNCSAFKYTQNADFSMFSGANIFTFILGNFFIAVLRVR